MSVNNVTRFLDSRKVDYSVHELPQEKLGGLETAHLLNASPEIVFKSIVILRKGPGKPILAVVPGSSEVDLKKLAKTLGEKKVLPASQKEAERLTGLQVGGISPLALINRGFQVVIHISVEEFEFVHISGGERGVNLHLPAADLVSLTHAQVADIA